MRNPISVLTERLRSSEKFKGFFDTGKSLRKKRTRFYPGEITWGERCKHYDEMCEQFGLASQAMFTIAGQLLGKAKDGVFLSPAKNRKTGKPNEHAVEAMHKCEDLNDRIGLPLMLYDLGYTLPKHGSCFWEKTFSPVFDTRTIPYQEGVEPAEQNDIGEITRWRQRTQWGKTHAEWGLDGIIEFHWNVTTRSWPYGTSLLAGSETEYEIMEQLELNAKDFMEKQAWPYEAMQVGDGQFMPPDDQVAALKSKWKNRQIGENVITTYPTQLLQGGTGGHPITELSTLLDFLKDNVIDRTLVPPISKQYNATQASAKEMMPWCLANLIWPLQRLVKWKVENQVYKPFLESEGFSVKTCPDLLFEPPDMIDAEKHESLSKGVLAGYIPPRWAAIQSGVPEEEFDKYIKEEQQREAEQFMRDKTLGQQQGGFGNKPEKLEQGSQKRTEQE